MAGPRALFGARPGAAAATTVVPFTFERGRDRRSTMGSVDLREELKRGLRRHPRVALQGFFDDAEALARLAAALPTFVPFKGTH